MSSAVNITPQPNSQKRKGGRAPLPEVEENFTRLPPGPGDRTERAVCKHCAKERSWHTTELVKHLDKCAQYTPSKRQKYTRPWRIERPGEGRSPNQPQSQQPSPQQLQGNGLDLTSRNVRVGPTGMFQWDGGMVTARLPTSNNTDGRAGEDQHQRRPSTLPPPIADPDQRLHSFIDYERGAMAWQNRPEDLDAIEAWLQHHRFDIEDIKEISENRWADSWGLKLGDLYRIKRDVQTFKIFSAR
ncbi:hypothetical protein D6C97_05189 [Aureobasidium pullulans]|nr:hypothetical protein D6C97_05189 [Aureobasidium pullulans]